MIFQVISGLIETFTKIHHLRNASSMAQTTQKRRQREKYTKIPVKTKVSFLRMVLYQGHSIRDASLLLSINYSTAKTLIRLQRLNVVTFDIDQQTPSLPLPASNPQSSARCSYRAIEPIQKKGQQGATSNEYGGEREAWSPVWTQVQIIGSIGHV